MGSSSSKDENEDGYRRGRGQRDIREEDRLVIDAASLTCPTCMETFSKAPLVLYCGHSFCRTCIGHFVRPGVGSVQPSFLECPMCLRRSAFARQNDPNQLAVVNYAMDNILDGLRVMANAETVDFEQVTLIPTLRFENKRLQAEKQEKDRIISDLRQQLQASERKIGFLTTGLANVEHEFLKMRFRSERDEEEKAHKRKGCSFFESFESWEPLTIVFAVTFFCGAFFFFGILCSKACFGTK